MADILRWKDVKTRKPHKCWGCYKTYPAGTEMVSAAYADGGSVHGCYWCETCVEYMNRYFEQGDECVRGDIYAGDPDAWKELQLELARERDGENG